MDHQISPLDVNLKKALSDTPPPLLLCCFLVAAFSLVRICVLRGHRREGYANSIREPQPAAPSVSVAGKLQGNTKASRLLGYSNCGH